MKNKTVWSNRFKGETSISLQKIGSSINVDKRLYEQDIAASIIHAKMLMKQKIIDQYREEGEAIFCSARLWDDGIIDPINTRKILIHALNAIEDAPIKEMKFPVFRM